MSKSELFDVLNEQLFDRLMNFDAMRKGILTSFDSSEEEKLGKIWLDFAKSSASTLNQIATASRLERYEYQETLSENIKSLKSNPKALEVITKSRDQSILVEFFAKALSSLYYETVIEGICDGPKDPSVVTIYANQSQELSELILFSLGKELLFEDEEFLKILVNIGKVNFESNINEQLNSFEKRVRDQHKNLMLERKIKNLRYKGTLYKDSYTKILDVAKEHFWWDDQILRYCLYSKADHYFSEAREILTKNPIDPSLLMTIDFEIALCRGQAHLARGEHYLELAINTLISGTHQQSYDNFMLSNKYFNDSLKEVEQVSVESSFSQDLINRIKSNLEFTELFMTLLALSCSIIEISSTKLSKNELKARIESLVSLSEAPLANIEYYSQFEFLNTVGFILENLKILSKHETLNAERIQIEIKKGFKRLGLIFKGRLDNMGRSFLFLPWEDDQEDIEIKNAYCETEPEKIQEILISVLLMPPYIPDRKILTAKSRALLNIVNSEAYSLKGLKEKNATKALCLMVKSHLAAKESYDNLKKGKVFDELKEFVEKEFSRTYVQSHLKEASILQTGNQYFFARYLLRTLPDILSTLDLNRVPKEIATLIIENHGGMFDSMITIWDRLSAHYTSLLEHNKEYQIISDDTINWDYIEKKTEHTKGAMLFFKSCQSVVQAQEFANIKERVKAEKYFLDGSKYANESAHAFNTIIDTLKGEVQQLPKDLYNFASFCKNQSIKVSQGKKIDELPVKDFVVLIGIISASL
ncbi:MAG TPA: hypothetical protein VMX55_14920 [candidate division Zixibacteria bacterium]|nr:hypothetical protein [candidate division Zixibacteria bacterium]